MTTIIDEIFDLFARYGTGRYGEDLSLGAHMLQSAAMAESLGAGPSVITAALLHDIGYFLHADAERDFREGRDFAHEIVGANWLRRAFKEDVTAPIAMHVRAKRYLCAVEPDYFGQLSDASRHTLIAQGSVMTEAEVAEFARAPYFDAALIVRRCDDGGKNIALSASSLERYRPLVIAALR